MQPKKSHLPLALLSTPSEQAASGETKQGLDFALSSFGSKPPRSADVATTSRPAKSAPNGGVPPVPVRKPV